MKKPDLDRERSEERHSLASFLVLYNEGLPEAFPSATKALLEEYRSTHGEAFKTSELWSLDIHRKRVMDWLRGRAPQVLRDYQ